MTMRLRAGAYLIAFVLNLAVFSLVFWPIAHLPRRRILFVSRSWAMANAHILRLTCGIDHEVRGAEHMPSGAALVAAKHQSSWETLALLHILPDPVIVLRQAFARLPVFGWWAVKFGHLAIDREGGPPALRKLIGDARAAAADGCQVVIFPEGTRRPPGAPPAYLRGIVAVYRALGVPCVPVALNSGLYWPRGPLPRRPGRIVIEFLPAIPPGLDSDALMAEMEARIESATAALVDEARQNGLE